MDFAALMGYDPASAEFKHAIDLLERESPPPVRAVGELLDQRSSAGGYPQLPSRNESHRGWIDRRLSARQTPDRWKWIPRPQLPSREAVLVLPEMFLITFAEDAICVYLALRWRRFLTDKAWQHVALAAAEHLARMFSVFEGVVTNDCSPVIDAFTDGASYFASLAAGNGSDGEKRQLGDLYQILDEAGTWDSHGYWRFYTAP